MKWWEEFLSQSPCELFLFPWDKGDVISWQPDKKRGGFEANLVLPSILYTSKATTVCVLARDWMFPSPQNSYVEASILNVMYLEGGPSGGNGAWLKSWGWGRCPYRGDQRARFLSPVYRPRNGRMKPQGEDGHLQTREWVLTWHGTWPAPSFFDFPASRTVRNRCLWFRSPSLWCFITAAWMKMVLPPILVKATPLIYNAYCRIWFFLPKELANIVTGLKN